MKSSKLFNRVFNMDFARQIYKSRDYLLLYGGKNDQGKDNESIDVRGRIVKEELSPEKHVWIKYRCTGLSQERQIQDNFTAVYPDDVSVDYSSIEQNEMLKFLSYIHKLSKNLLIDFSLVNSRFMGALLSSLYLLEWDSVIFCYTEPGKYSRQKVMSSKKEYMDFNFNNQSMGIEEIPGLYANIDPTAECNWIVILGFEGSRARQLEDEASYGKKHTIPVICIPSMRAEWHNHAINANISFLSSILQDGTFDSLGYVSATNPFDVYNFLLEEKQKIHNTKLYLQISPLGTKPTILGALMYILQSSEDMLLFDNIYQSGIASEESGKVHFYDLSMFIRETRNSRTFIADE
jgi:hypothetical protein